MIPDLHQEHLVDGMPARALKAIEGKEPLDQLGLLQQYVEQAERDSLDEHAINIMRRRYIRIASELYRGRDAT